MDFAESKDSNLGDVNVEVVHAEKCVSGDEAVVADIGAGNYATLRKFIAQFPSNHEGEGDANPKQSLKDDASLNNSEVVFHLSSESAGSKTWDISTGDILVLDHKSNPMEAVDDRNSGEMSSSGVANINAFEERSQVDAREGLALEAEHVSQEEILADSGDEDVGYERAMKNVEEVMRAVMAEALEETSMDHLKTSPAAAATNSPQQDVQTTCEIPGRQSDSRREGKSERVSKDKSSRRSFLARLRDSITSRNSSSNKNEKLVDAVGEEEKDEGNSGMEAVNDHVGSLTTPDENIDQKESSRTGKKTDPNLEREGIGEVRKDNIKALPIQMARGKILMEPANVQRIEVTGERKQDLEGVPIQISGGRIVMESVEDRETEEFSIEIIGSRTGAESLIADYSSNCDAIRETKTNLKDLPIHLSGGKIIMESVVGKSREVAGEKDESFRLLNTPREPIRQDLKELPIQVAGGRIIMESVEGKSREVAGEQKEPSRNLKELPIQVAGGRIIMEAVEGKSRNVAGEQKEPCQNLKELPIQVAGGRIVMESVGTRSEEAAAVAGSEIMTAASDEPEGKPCIRIKGGKVVMAAMEGLALSKAVGQVLAEDEEMKKSDKIPITVSGGKIVMEHLNEAESTGSADAPSTNMPIHVTSGEMEGGKGRGESSSDGTSSLAELPVKIAGGKILMKIAEDLSNSLVAPEVSHLEFSTPITDGEIAMNLAEKSYREDNEHHGSPYAKRVNMSTSKKSVNQGEDHREKSEMKAAKRHRQKDNRKKFSPRDSKTDESGAREEKPVRQRRRQISRGDGKKLLAKAREGDDRRRTYGTTEYFYRRMDIALNLFLTKTWNYVAWVVSLCVSAVCIWGLIELSYGLEKGELWLLNVMAALLFKYLLLQPGFCLLQAVYFSYVFDVTVELKRHRTSHFHPQHLQLCMDFRYSKQAYYRAQLEGDTSELRYKNEMMALRSVRKTRMLLLCMCVVLAMGLVYSQHSPFTFYNTLALRRLLVDGSFYQPSAMPLARVTDYLSLMDYLERTIMRGLLEPPATASSIPSASRRSRNEVLDLSPSFKLATARPSTSIVIPLPVIPMSKPTTTTARPKATTARPKATTARPKVTTARPKATTALPKATTVRPEATTARPKVTAALPKATTARPEATTARPKVTTALPNATTARPEVTTARPKVTTALPKATTARPKVTTARPKATTSTAAPTTSGKPYTVPMSERAAFAVDSNYKLLADIRLRQLRVNPDKCIEFECAGEWKWLGSNMDRKDYGMSWRPLLPGERALNVSINQDMLPWIYSEGKDGEALTDGWTGRMYPIGLYPANGYVIYAGKSAYNAHITLQFINDFNWIDHLTRVVFVELTLYNVNTDVYSMVTIIVEVSATGVYIPSYQIDSRRVRSWTWLGVLTGVALACCLIASACYLAYHLKITRERIGLRIGVDIVWMVACWTLLLSTAVTCLRARWVFGQMDSVPNMEYISYHSLRIPALVSDLAGASAVAVLTVVVGWKLLASCRCSRFMLHTPYQLITLSWSSIAAQYICLLCLALLLAVCFYLQRGGQSEGWGAIWGAWGMAQMLTTKSVRARNTEYLLTDWQLTLLISAAVMAVPACAGLIAAHVFSCVPAATVPIHRHAQALLHSCLNPQEIKASRAADMRRLVAHHLVSERTLEDMAFASRQVMSSISPPSPPQSTLP